MKGAEGSSGWWNTVFAQVSPFHFNENKVIVIINILLTTWEFSNPTRKQKNNVTQKVGADSMLDLGFLGSEWARLPRRHSVPNAHSEIAGHATQSHRRERRTTGGRDDDTFNGKSSREHSSTIKTPQETAFAGKVCTS